MKKLTLERLAGLLAAADMIEINGERHHHFTVWGDDEIRSPEAQLNVYLDGIDLEAGCPTWSFTAGQLLEAEVKNNALLVEAADGPVPSDDPVELVFVESRVLPLPGERPEEKTTVPGADRRHIEPAFDFTGLGLAEERDEGYRNGTILIGGAPHHVEAIEVEEADERGISAVNPLFQGRIDAVRDFDEGGRYRVAIHDGKPYFIVIFPYQL